MSLDEKKNKQTEKQKPKNKKKSKKLFKLQEHSNALFFFHNMYGIM